MVKALSQLPGPCMAKMPVKWELKEEPIDVEPKPSMSSILQVIINMLNMKGVKVVWLWMAVSEKIAHGDKPWSLSYDRMAVKYGIMRKFIVNLYSQRPHPGCSAYTKKRKLEEVEEEAKWSLCYQSKPPSPFSTNSTSRWKIMKSVNIN